MKERESKAAGETFAVPGSEIVQRKFHHRDAEHAKLSGEKILGWRSVMPSHLAALGQAVALFRARVAPDARNVAGVEGRPVHGDEVSDISE